MVNDCFAHNGGHKKIQLIDEYGYVITARSNKSCLNRNIYRCPVDDKLISRFRGSWSETGVYETQVFAYMKTFRFTGSPALYIECDVRMCHGRCPVGANFYENSFYFANILEPTVPLAKREKRQETFGGLEPPDHHFARKHRPLVGKCEPVPVFAGATGGRIGRKPKRHADSLRYFPRFSII